MIRLQNENNNNLEEAFMKQMRKLRFLKTPLFILFLLISPVVAYMIAFYPM